MNKEKFIEKMTQKLTYGDCISNEDIMRGLLILLAEDDNVGKNVGKTEETKKSEEFDAKAIANAFYNSHESALPSDIEEDARKLRKELTFIQYTKVVSEISQFDNGRTSSLYRVRKIVDAMNNI